jgi:hypothetical protein
MALLARLHRTLGINATAQRSAGRPDTRPLLEALEDRCVPSAAGSSSISANFNHAPIPAGDTVWFSSELQTSGLKSSAVTLHFTNQTITFKVNGTTESVAVPDATVIYSPTATTATTSFDTATNSWVTTLPLHQRGAGFLDGVELAVPKGGLPGNIKDVTWQGQFSSDTGGVTVRWDWSAAVYTHLSTDYNALDVKPVSSRHGSRFRNSDEAGTPEAFKHDVTRGATGRGHRNYTGNHTRAGRVTVPVVLAPTPGTLSGVVTDGTTSLPLAGVTLTLTETVNGQTVVVGTTQTGTDGTYSFKNLLPGTYTITQTPPVEFGLTEMTNQVVGTVNGRTDGAQGVTTDVITGITVASGNNGVNYNFNDVFRGS